MIALPTSSEVQMRIRTRGETPQTIGQDHTFYDTGTSTGTTHSSYQRPPLSYEYFADEVGIGSYHPASHYKYIYSYFGPSSWSYDLFSPPAGAGTRHTFQGEMCIADLILYDFVSQRPIASNVPLPLNGVDQFILRGFQNIRPKFKGDVSLPNFLFELKDLKRILPSRQRISELSESLKTFVGNPFRNSKRFANDVLDETSSQYLNAKFGYLPLIDDVFKLIEDFKNFNQRIDTFLQQGKKPQVGHYKEVVPAFTSESTSSGDSWYDFSTETAYSDVTYVLTLKYGYTVNIPKLYVPSTFARYVGFRSNPRILWDALPFSFVLDWVLKIGKMLESFDDGAIPVSLHIIDSCVSRKYSTVRKVRIRNVINAIGMGSFGSSTLVSQEGLQAYDRWQVDPRSILLSGLPPLPVIDKISISEFTLGLALGRTLTRRG
jgi:hypothetical protein